jgi:hypothetical protein
MAWTWFAQSSPRVTSAWNELGDARLPQLNGCGATLLAVVCVDVVDR